MKRKVISLSLIVLMIAGLFLLTGCNKNINENIEKQNKNIEKENIEKELKKINADAIVYCEFFGGECMEDLEYHICYDALKVYEYEIMTYVPMSSFYENGKTESSSTEYTLKKYDVSKEQMEKLKQLIEQEKDKSVEVKNNEGRYRLGIDGHIYKVEKFTTINTILKEIESN